MRQPHAVEYSSANATMSLNLPATIPSALTATLPLARLVFVVIRLELEWIMNIRMTKAFQCMLSNVLLANVHTGRSSTLTT